MAGEITIYHNPRCSKSRQTLALLREHGVEPRIVEYLKTPPEPDEIRDLLDRLAMAPRELLRSGEAAFRELGLGDESIDDERIIAAMHRHPKLIQRPIVVAGERAAIGRPPEAVLDLLP